MHFKLVLLAAHLGFALASPAGTGIIGNTNALQARDAPQADHSASSYNDGSYNKDGNGYDKHDDNHASGYNKDGAYGQSYGGDKDHGDNAYPKGQDSYNPGRLDLDQNQKTDSGPADTPHDVNKQWDGQGSYGYDQHKDQYDNSHNDQHGQSYGQPHKDDYSGDKSKGYDNGYDGHHDDKDKGYGGYGGDSYSQKGYDDHHCPDRQHAVPFHRPGDDHDVIGYFFEHQEPQTFHLFAIYNEHTDDYFYTIDLAEKIIYMKQFGFEKDKGIIGYIFHDYGCGGVPLYRVFNRHEHKYYFTTSEEKKHEKLGAGWEDGGITGYIYKH